MNKFLQKLAKIFLGLSMAAGVGVAIGTVHDSVKETFAAITDDDLDTANAVSITFSSLWNADHDLSTSGEQLGSTDYNISRNGTSTVAKYYNSGTAVRVYANGSNVTFSSTTKKLGKIVFTNTQNAANAASSGTLSGTTWTAENTNTSSVSFTRTSSGQWRFSAIQITPIKETPFTAKEFVQCTSTSDLEAGSTYIITNGTSGSVATMSTEENTNNRKSTTVTVSNSKISSTLSTLTLTLGGTTGAWTFHTDNYATTDGYLTPGSSTSNARLNVSASNDNYGLYTISFSSGKAVITSTGKSSYHIMRCNPNGGSPLFACYSSGQNDIYLWRENTTKVLSSLSITGTPSKLSGYYDSDTFDPTGITAYTANYDNGSTKTLSASDITWPALVANMGTIKGSYTEGGVTVYTPTYNISVSADTLSTVTLSGSMTTSYNTNDNWDIGSLVVTANYLSGKTLTVTTTATIAYYSDSAMTQAVATPADLGVGNNQTIYVKATYSGVSNTTAYSQTVSVTRAPTEQTATINFVNVTLNDSVSQDATDVSIVKGAVTFAWTKTSGQVAANSYLGGYDSHTETRIYTGHHITVTASSNVIKSIEFTGTTGTAHGPSKLSTWTNGTLTDSDTTAGTATVTASASATSLECTPSANTYLTQAIVHYYATDVAATGITINGQASSSVSITPYQTTRLVASVLPLDATDRTFTWSLNPNTEIHGNQIITIDQDGNVEPISEKFGSTVVTATSHDGGFTATCTVTVERVSYHQAVYTPTSTSTVTSSGTIPTGSTSTFTCDAYTSSDKVQLGNLHTNFTLTLTGYTGQTIRSILLTMKSNQSSGSGSLSVTAGSTTIASISNAAFNSSTWNGEWSTSWVLIELDLTEYDVGNNENIVIQITGSANSIFVADVRVQFETTEIDNTAVTFAQMILDDITCNSLGTTAPDPEDWGILVEFWEDGTTITTAGKEVLVEVIAAEYADPQTDAEILAAAMAKYDYIIGKYNKTLGLTTDYPDFIGRNPSPVGGQRIGLFGTISENTNTVAIIVIISMVSVTAIGGYFFLRKRREDI